MRFIKFGWAMFLLMPAICFADNTGFSNAEVVKWNTSYFLPHIEVSGPHETSYFFSKNPRSDSFQTLVDNEETVGVAQDYISDVCLARISYFNPKLGRLSNTKIKRYLKEKTYFQITYQDSSDISGERNHYTVSTHPDQTDVLLVKQTGNNLLQVRLTCQTAASFTQKENRQAAVEWAKTLAEKTASRLKDR